MFQKHSLAVLSDQDGWIKAIDAFEVGLINNKLGGGRETLDSKIDFKAGLVFHFKVGDQVKVPHLPYSCLVLLSALSPMRQAGEALVTLFTDGTYPDYLSGHSLSQYALLCCPETFAQTEL